MRKIPRELDHPFENILVDGAEIVSPYFRQLNFTPNMITTVSNVFSLLAVYCAYKRQFPAAAVLWIIGFFFDCVDGYYARKYKMVSEFGDLYDHISDVVIYILLWATLFWIDVKLFALFFSINAFICIMMSVHLGCQEVYHNSDDSPALESSKRLCPANNKRELAEQMKYTRFFGPGTLACYIAAVLLIYGVHH
jgi:phosphatidylglycerophosphate synthase